MSFPARTRSGIGRLAHIGNRQSGSLRIFHVYGFEWDPTELRWFVDGGLVRNVQNTHWHQLLFLTFDSETMPEWFGMPEDADLPSTFTVEYIRAWTKKASYAK